jgi:polar amino acid transport system permease protein
MRVEGRLKSGIWLDGIKFGLLAAVAVALMAAATGRLGYHWQWYRLPRYLAGSFEDGWEPGPLLAGLGVTFEVAGASLLLASAFGLIAALMRLSSSLTARFAARAYLELIRNTPLLVQLFFIYFVAAPIAGMNAFSSAVLALSLFEGAYASELFRAGILSIRREQWEAAFSLGLGRLKTYRLVILPQALRNILPPLTSQAISLVKDSALVSTIAIADLTMQAQSVVSETFLVFEVWFTVAAVYLAVTLSLSLAAGAMERRMHRYRL